MHAIYQYVFNLARETSCQGVGQLHKAPHESLSSKAIFALISAFKSLAANPSPALKHFNDIVREAIADTHSI